MSVPAWLWPSLLCLSHVVQPDTILRWHRAGFRAYWRWKSRGRPGRPRVSRELRELIQRMSKENPLWGAPRIHGELLKLGFEIAESTVSKYMIRRRGPPSQTWRTFLRNHAAERLAGRGGHDRWHGSSDAAFPALSRLAGNFSTGDQVARDCLHSHAVRSLWLIYGTSKNSRHSTSRFAVSSTPRMVTPVTLPPGRLRLGTRPSATGSPPVTKTIGMVVVAAFAASAGGVPVTATITVTSRRTRSANSAGNRSC